MYTNDEIIRVENNLMAPNLIWGGRQLKTESLKQLRFRRDGRTEIATLNTAHFMIFYIFYVNHLS